MAFPDQLQALSLPRAAIPHASLAPVPCAAEVELLHRSAAREAVAMRSRFTVLPGRLDGGMDAQWGSRSHRMKVRMVRAVAADRDRRAGKPQPVYLRGPVNGAFRALIVGLLIELLAGMAIAGFVVARKVY